MRLIIFLSVALAATSLVASGEQQRILRRVIKSTPTANSLGRVRAVTVRSSGPEKGAVSEISSKEAAAFGARSTNETAAAAAAAAAAATSQQTQQATKTKSVQTTSTSTTTTATTSTAATPSPSPPSSPTTTTTTTSTTSTTQAPGLPKASERQQVAPQAAAAEVELLSSAPSSWQMMTAVEAPAAALIATGTRAAGSSDLSSSSSEETSSRASYAPQGDFLRSSGKTSYSSSGETFSRLRQQSSASKTRQQQQQSFFYPQQQQQQEQQQQQQQQQQQKQQLRATSQGKTSNYQATKTLWYQPSTTPRPAPIIQQQQEQQYEQQNEQYVEQQQVESAAPPGQAEPFAFDFNTQDISGNGQYRQEESDNNGVVRGSYGFRDASGMYRHVEYVADANGFRANIKSNEPGLNPPEGVESQPASTRFSSGGQAPVQQNQRFTANNNNNNNNQDISGEWQAASSSTDERANLALAPPDFESSHKPERIQRATRLYKN